MKKNGVKNPWMVLTLSFKCDLKLTQTSNDIPDACGIREDVEYVLGGFSLLHTIKLSANRCQHGRQETKRAFQRERHWHRVVWRV